MKLIYLLIKYESLSTFTWMSKATNHDDTNKRRLSWVSSIDWLIDDEIVRVHTYRSSITYVRIRLVHSSQGESTSVWLVFSTCSLPCYIRFVDSIVHYLVELRSIENTTCWIRLVKTGIVLLQHAIVLVIDTIVFDDYLFFSYLIKEDTKLIFIEFIFWFFFLLEIQS
jgi:hypothetical protein